MKTRRLLRLGFAGAVALALATTAAAADPIARVGRDSFVHEQAGLRVKVRCYLPPDAGPETPVVFVLHGMGRNPQDDLKDWMPYAAQKHFLLVVPEFARTEFPGAAGYIYGNTIDRTGRPIARERWAFSMLEPIFDAVRQRTGNRSASYRLYGFSAGAQFVQRFLYFVPAARVSVAVAASAGWYMLPDLAAPFPYGLKNTPVGEADLRGALARPLILLLGDADTDPHSAALRHSPEADAQGPHRFARGQFFFGSAQAAAAARGVPCGWSLSLAPGVAHSESAMTPFAVRCLFPTPVWPANPNTP